MRAPERTFANLSWHAARTAIWQIIVRLHSARPLFSMALHIATLPRPQLYGDPHLKVFGKDTIQTCNLTGTITLLTNDYLTISAVAEPVVLDTSSNRTFSGASVLKSITIYYKNVWCGNETTLTTRGTWRDTQLATGGARGAAAWGCLPRAWGAIQSTRQLQPQCSCQIAPPLDLLAVAGPLQQPTSAACITDLHHACVRSGRAQLHHQGRPEHDQREGRHPLAGHGHMRVGLPQWRDREIHHHQQPPQAARHTG